MTGSIYANSTFFGGQHATSWGYEVSPRRGVRGRRGSPIKGYRLLFGYDGTLNIEFLEVFGSI